MVLTLAIAIGLAIDAFTVSIVSGCTERRCSVVQALRMAFLFGLFQAGMPAIGWLAGKGVETYIEAFDHWVAFGLLALISVRLFQQAATAQTDPSRTLHPFAWRTLLVLAIVTSIDALAVGMSVALIGVSLWQLVIATGVITFVLSLAGIGIGKRFGMVLGRAAYTFGGVVLLGIGVKILVEHLA